MTAQPDSTGSGAPSGLPGARDAAHDVVDHEFGPPWDEVSDEFGPPWDVVDEHAELGPLPPDPEALWERPARASAHGEAPDQALDLTASCPPELTALLPPDDDDPQDNESEWAGRRLASDELAGVEPGLFLAAELELATALERTSPGDVDEYQLVEMVAGYQRIAAWAQHRMTELAGRLARRPALNPQSPVPGKDALINVAAEELAPRLGLSRFAAQKYVDNARLFRLKLEDTGEALRTGQIDFVKACVLARLLKDQPDDVAWEVQQLVLPDAPFQTVTQIERSVHKAIIAIDPHRATARYRKARQQRRVGRPKPLPDGMASIFAIMPGTDAAGVDLVLEAAARTAKASGDTRTIDQLRADTLALLAHGALERGFVGVHASEESTSHAVSDPAHTHGEATNDDAHTHGEATNDRAHPQDEATNDHAHPSPPEDAPACEETGARHAADPATEGGTTAGAGRAQPAAEGAESAPAMECGNMFLRTLHMPIGTIGGYRARIHVTVPLSVLIPPEALSHGDSPGDTSAHPHVPGDTPARSTEHSDDETGEVDLPDDWYPGPTPAEVAELDGYGPITPDVAQELAYSGGTWQRLVTDPLSGALLDVGRTRYRPPASIADFVRLRDRTCIHPTCTVPARSCQLDHIEPWHEGGSTSTENLGPECGRDHVVKSTGAFRVEHLGNGTFEWAAPSGHRYRRDRTGRITHVARSDLAATGGSPSAVGASTAGSFSEEPPF